MFIRYNETLDFWEYDTSPDQNGTGPWVLLPIDSNKLIGAGGLPSNIAFTNKENKFTTYQTIESAVPYVSFHYTPGGVDQKNSRFEGVGDFYISHVNDADNSYITRYKFGRDGTLGVPGNLGVQGFIGSNSTIYAGGPFVERGRPVPVGEWIEVPFNAANFYATIGTWTVTAGNVQTNKYTLIGKTMIWVLNLGPATLSDAVQHIIITLPAGITPTTQVQGTCQLYSGGGWGLGLMSWTGGTNTNFYKSDITFMPAGSMYLSFQFIIPLA